MLLIVLSARVVCLVYELKHDVGSINLSSTHECTDLTSCRRSKRHVHVVCALIRFRCNAAIVIQAVIGSGRCSAYYKLIFLICIRVRINIAHLYIALIVLGMSTSPCNILELHGRSQRSTHKIHEGIVVI